MNRRQSGKTCSPTCVFVAVALLIAVGTVALTIGSGAVKFPVANAANSQPLFASLRPAATAPSARVSQVLATYSHLPLMFEPNQGQTDAKVRFLARGSGYGLYLTAQEAVLSLRHPAADSRHLATSVVSMKLVGAASAVEPVGDVQLPGRSNYFIGNDPAKWHRDIPQFARVRYRGVYPGIDLVYYGNHGQLEYDFEVAPGSDPKIVGLKLKGSQNLRIDAGGDLVVAVGSSNVRL